MSSPPGLTFADYRDLVTVRSFRDLSEAIVARNAIESAGIFCILQDENFARVYSSWESNWMGGLRLQVDASDVEAAEAILTQPPGNIKFADEPAFEQPSCPRCKSDEICLAGSTRGFALGTAKLLPIPADSDAWICEHCGLAWLEDES